MSTRPALADPEIAGEGERDRLIALCARFSREDLLRAFDLLTRAEADIRAAAQPRYHLEMALLRWIHLRKLTPIEDLIAGRSFGGDPSARVGVAARARRVAPDRSAAVVRRSRVPCSGGSAVSCGVRRHSDRSSPPSAVPVAASDTTRLASGAVAPAAGAAFKDAFLAEVRKTKAVFYNMVVAQAQTIDANGDRVTFTFSATQRTLRETFEQHRSWLESIAEKIAGRRVVVTAEQVAAVAATPAAVTPPDPAAIRKSVLREQAHGRCRRAGDARRLCRRRDP